MTKNTILRPKLAGFGWITAKLSLRLKFAAPQFHSWDLLWLFLAVELIKAREQAWASSFYSNFASFGAYLAKNEGHTSFFWSCESTFQLFFINLDVFLWPKEHKMHLESPNQFFWTFEKKTSFFGLFVAIFLKIAVKSWNFPLKSCFNKKHMSFRSKIWNQMKKVIFRKFEIVPLLRHCAPPIRDYVICARPLRLQVSWVINFCCAVYHRYLYTDLSNSDLRQLEWFGLVSS